jgi:hypothetical protein
MVRSPTAFPGEIHALLHFGIGRVDFQQTCEHCFRFIEAIEPAQASANLQACFQIVRGGLSQLAPHLQCSLPFPLAIQDTSEMPERTLVCSIQSQHSAECRCRLVKVA